MTEEPLAELSSCCTKHQSGSLLPTPTLWAHTGITLTISPIFLSFLKHPTNSNHLRIKSTQDLHLVSHTARITLPTNQAKQTSTLQQHKNFPLHSPSTHISSPKIKTQSQSPPPLSQTNTATNSSTTRLEQIHTTPSYRL